MRIREINAMRGPNYWSVRRHKLIVMVLDLEEMEDRPSNKIDGFLERLKMMFPSMYSHRCSVGEPGGFFKEWKKARGWAILLSTLLWKYRPWPIWTRASEEPATMAKKAFTM